RGDVNGSVNVRDRAMADNIGWLLDHEPRGTRMVVWAHNGHVAREPGQMGSHLWKRFGKAVVTFGFSFNQGSFQSMQIPFGRGKLHEFTVPPAPPGSLDATLAATGLPLLALDLRDVPQSGAIADWFAAPHNTRSIGAAFADQFATQSFARL